MNEWMSEWINEWMNEWMHECMNEWTNEQINDWLTEWMNEWMTDWMNEWMNWSMNQLFSVATGFFRCCSCSAQEPKAFESSCIGWDTWDAGAPSWNVVIDKILCRLLICYAFRFPFLAWVFFSRKLCLKKSWCLSKCQILTAFGFKSPNRTEPAPGYWQSYAMWVQILRPRQICYS